MSWPGRKFAGCALELITVGYITVAPPAGIVGEEFAIATVEAGAEVAGGADAPAEVVGVVGGIGTQVQLEPSELTFVGYSPGGQDGPVGLGFDMFGRVRGPTVGRLVGSGGYRKKIQFNTHAPAGTVPLRVCKSPGQFFGSLLLGQFHSWCVQKAPKGILV